MLNNTRARNFITLIIVIAVVSLLLRIAIARIIKINISQNESVALLTLKLISTALENYAKDNHGAFPSTFSALIKTKPSYLDKDYIAESPVKGYNYTCSRLDSFGYSCSAIPVKCNITAKVSYAVTTGALLVSERCGKKD